MEGLHPKSDKHHLNSYFVRWRVNSLFTELHSLLPVVVILVRSLKLFLTKKSVHIVKLIVVKK